MDKAITCLRGYVKSPQGRVTSGDMACNYASRANCILCSAREEQYKVAIFEGGNPINYVGR